MGGAKGLQQLVCVAPASAQRLERRSEAQRLSDGNRVREPPLRPPADCLNVAQVTVYGRALGMALIKRVKAPTNTASGQRSNRGFLKAVERRGTHQGQLAWYQLDHRDDLHRRVPQRKAGATGRVFLTNLRT